MNATTVKILCKLNNDFYRNHHASFSATRKTPWPGWKTCLDVLRNVCADDWRDFCRNLTVFDLACGNLRFEKYIASELSKEFPDIKPRFFAIDNCDGMVSRTPDLSYQSLDVLDTLQQGFDINAQLTAPLCDIAVSFGFMHHVPSRELRQKVLLSLIRQTRRGGFVFVSFWQFQNDRVMTDRARVVHERALKELNLLDLDGNDLDGNELDDNDYLLGWENTPGVYRYCHSFTNAEIDQLLASVADKANLVSRFVSDGRTSNLNAYLVLKVLEDGKEV